MTSQHNRIVSCCLSRWQKGKHHGWAPPVFVSEGVWVEVRCETLQPQGCLHQIGGGGIYSSTEAIWTSCGSPLVPNKWWCPLSTVPSAAWCGVNGISPATCQLLLDTNVPEGWLCGCIMAGFGAPDSHLPCTNSGESPLMGNNKVHLCAQGSTAPETLLRRPPCSTTVGLFPGLAPHCKMQSWHQGRQPVLRLVWVSPEQNISQDKLIVPRLLQGAARQLGTDILQGAEHRATRCWGGSVFLLESQILAARQAKCELSSTCYLKAPPDECSDSRRFVSLI